jgi:hypothetical protein
MSKPTAQRCAWRDVFDPLVEVNFFLRQAAWPQAIDEDAIFAAVAPRIFVDADHVDGIAGPHFAYYRGAVRHFAIDLALGRSGIGRATP